ncbi:hypothetical protein GP2_089_00010 [Gordonia paraffinivorans NBRC 108238]|uniref:Uncharacterized protein n=2 Tax=Gordonia paraffinivorans TaxID=175628 RepID=A0ABQ0IS17_9ACTN|nr:hypothetical protein GP2_089_00010 [Gordonia paraffinivorans NBRC 108238]
MKRPGFVEARLSGTDSDRNLLGSVAGRADVQHSNPANMISIHMECNGGFIPSAVIDIGDWSVILDEPVAGRRHFEGPSEAAVALLQFYGFADDEEVDG